MTDTIRTLDQILALLADNTTDDISPQDLRDQTVTLNSFIESAVPYSDRDAALAASPAAPVLLIAYIAPDGSVVTFRRDPAGTALTTNGGTVNWSAVNDVSPLNWGAVFDGTADDTTPVAAYLDFVGIEGDPTYLINSTASHPDVRHPVSVFLSSATAAPIYKMENLSGVRLSDSYLKATGSSFFCFNILEGVSGFFLTDTRIETDGFSVLLKPSLSTTKNATSATNAASAVITSNSHGFSVGDLVKAAYLTGGTWPAEGGKYFTISAATADTFTINLNSTGLGTLTGAKFVSSPIAVENGVISGNHVLGVSTTADVGISLDGDVRNVVGIGNLVENFQRSDNARPAHSIAVAGGDGDDIAYAKSENIMFIGNAASDIAGNAFHLEDNCPLVSYSFNISDDVKKMIEIVNDDVPTLGNYIGNHVSNFTEYAIDSVGIGHSSKMNFVFNLMDGSDTTQTGLFATRIGQLATENINHIGNMYYDLTTGAIQVTADGPTTHAYNVFDTVGGDAITGRPNTTSRAMMIESNNKFKSISGSIVNKANSANIIGDREQVSPTLDASVAETYTYCIAQRAGWITGVTRVLVSSGGGGAVNGTFVVEKVTGTTAVTVLSNTIGRFAAEHDVFLWGSEHTSILANDFAKGDILRIRNTGAADAVTMYAVQIEYFYYN
tara:strand:+ start:1472 stop:3475 length:2004 start_codon:yes stop_codon:yes gene_type:complete